MGNEGITKHRYWLVALTLLVCFQVQPAGAEDFTQLRKAAERGDAAAHDKLRHAAEQGDPEAQWNLGRMYEYGRGVPQDHPEAARWYRRAAEQGHATAQYNLGWMYATGKGVAQDDREAEKWFRRAAQPEKERAQDAAAFEDRQGEEIAEDVREAEKSYRRAAKPVDAAAQNRLRPSHKQERPQAQDNPGRARRQGVAARSRELVDLEVVTSEPMQVWINGQAVKMNSEFGFAMARIGSNRLTIVHTTDQPSLYRLDRGAIRAASPEGGRNKVEFDVTVDAGDSIRIDVEESPPLFRGETTFGYYHLVKDRRVTVPLAAEAAEMWGLACREIELRTVPHQKSRRHRIFKRRWWYDSVDLEGSLCGQRSINGAVNVDLAYWYCGNGSYCWFEQKFATAAGTLTLALRFNWFHKSSAEKDDMSVLSREPARAVVRLTK